MRMSHLFGNTLREAPGDAELASHQLLLRAGFIRPLASGIFSYLPLAHRSLAKIENIMRQEMDAIGGQEITMPVVHPSEIWKESGRWYQIGTEMGRFQDKSGREMALAMTHEEVVADLVRKEIRSYRQLPMLVYHIQTKWRDDPRPRGGLIRVREFTMKDSYSLDADAAGLDLQYRRHYQAYFNIFHRCGLEVIAVKADSGMMGGAVSHEFMYVSPAGEDTLVLCNNCNYSANRQVAHFRKTIPAQEQAKQLEKVATPHAKTIEALADFLGVPKSRTAKAVFMVGSIPHGTETIEHLIFAVIRGDMEVNENKLANAVKARELRPAREEEILAVGAAPGYASPLGLKDVLIVVDDAIPTSANLVAGANQEGYHLLNVNYGRDYTASVIADIAAAQEGSACPQCGKDMHLVRGVEVGNIFQLGTRYSEGMGAYYLDQDGHSKPVVMGSYGIGSGRLLACIAEQYHDERGLMWPVSIAPFPVHLVLLGKGKNSGPEELAEHLYRQLTETGLEVLYDDRQESPGVKFNDADLIGLPLRLTVSERMLTQGCVELKLRHQAEKTAISLEQVLQTVENELSSLQSGLAARVTSVPYRD
jgi:prolyl-tRNA synthetase